MERGRFVPALSPLDSGRLPAIKDNIRIKLYLNLSNFARRFAHSSPLSQKKNAMTAIMTFWILIRMCFLNRNGQIS